ncbi:hypothetical protein HN385_02400 [archaeon]|jgi:hypothetical protein|nr:hypothetical protein [archaeon]MBT3450768.1 hypothetical protein [archaeon]MBT6868819.1 hypothetical protein [archaeon]MBT7192960.1 hypothetical protein [archaeon]MBT7380926.1 hypothetical protein [archaeon]
MINTIIGLIGMILILLAFLLNEFYENFNQENKNYNLINIIGAGLLTLYSFMIMSWPFIILNAIWLIVAVVKLVKILRTD